MTRRLVGLAWFYLSTMSGAYSANVGALRSITLSNITGCPGRWNIPLSARYGRAQSPAHNSSHRLRSGEL